MKQGENKALVGLLAIIAFLLLGVVYYYVIIPKSEEKTATTNSINQLRIETSELQDKVALLSVVDLGENNDYELRKKLPVNRELDKLLHTLHEVEMISESKIISIQFNNYDGGVAEAKYVPPTDKALEDVDADKEEDDEGKESEEIEESEEQAEVDIDETIPITPIDIENLPEQLKLISLNVELKVLDYNHLLKFLNEVEDIERVVRIDSVNFYQPGEAELTKEDPDQRLTVSVQLTTFFSEDVGD